MPRIQPLGDRAWLARFDSEADAAAWAGAARAAARPGVVDLVLAYRSAAVYVDPDLADPAEVGEWLGRLTVADRADETTDAHRIVVPVLYDGDDLADVAGRVGLSVDEVIGRHVSAEYRVFAVGFQPGFPYAGYLPEGLAGLPRRDRPRTVVPAGSVAIAGRQTGIYPAPSPGGWHLLGRTPLTIADLERGFFPIRAGDSLRFRAIDRAEFDRLLGLDLGTEPP
ncbi:allophanate hydrolase subunit 1 [Isosphaeraceae bacterium EP7]